MSFLNEVLGAGGGSGLKFETVGTTHTGVITDPPKAVQQNDFDTKQPAFWDDAKTQPKMQAVMLAFATTESAREGTKIAVASHPPRMVRNRMLASTRRTMP